MVRRLALPLIPLVALLLAATPGSARARRGAAPLCRLPANAQRRGADKWVLVYEVQLGIYENEGAEVLGCAYGSRHTYRLAGPIGCGDSYCEPPLWALHVAGVFVAYESDDQRNVLVFDLRNGRVVHKAPIVPSSHVPYDVEQLVLKSDGSVAWIARPAITENYGEPALPPPELRKVDRHGSGLVASLTEEPFGLALRGGTLYWTQDGHRSSAPLD